MVKHDSQPMQAIQVCWDLTERNEKREIDGLIDACKALELSSGLILTYDQEEEREVKGLRISVFPVWKWLLADDIPQLRVKKK